MFKRFSVLFAVVSLAAAGAALVWYANAALDFGLGRYPGAVRLSTESFHLASEGGAPLTRQGEYETPDELVKVKRWYAARLHVSPAADNYYTSGSCAWLSGSNQALAIQHNTSVLLCSLPHGTRIVVNDSLGLWR